MSVDYFWLILLVASIAGAIDNHLMLKGIRAEMTTIRIDQRRIMDALNIQPESERTGHSNEQK